MPVYTFEGVRDRHAYRMVAAVNAYIFVGCVLHTCECFPGKTYKCAGGGQEKSHLRVLL